MTSGVHQTTHVSPSRSSLNCCQGSDDTASINDVTGVQTVTGKNDYVVKTKHAFPKRPEVDLAFNNVRFQVRSWNFRKLVPGTFCNYYY